LYHTISSLPQQFHINFEDQDNYAY
jgi:hypothetical protein